jgi:hypothetical protein
MWFGYIIAIIVHVLAIIVILYLISKEVDNLKKKK